jgi:hypothetical protein
VIRNAQMIFIYCIKETIIIIKPSLFFNHCDVLHDYCVGGPGGTCAASPTTERL